MTPRRRYRTTNAALFVATLGHALLTWRPASTAALFVGGGLLAFGAELVGVHTGLLEHELRPQIAGVPVSVILVWPAVVYATYRLALLAVPAGIPAATLAAVLATALDVLTDPNGVREGVWRYPEHPLSTPRFRGVPWWNFMAWFLLVFLTALVAAVEGMV